MKLALSAIVALVCLLVGCSTETENVAMGRFAVSFSPLRSGTISRTELQTCPPGNPHCWGGNGSVFFDNHDRCIAGPQLPDGSTNAYGSGVEFLDFSAAVCDWTKPVTLLLWTREENAGAQGRIERPLRPVVLPAAGAYGAASWSTVGWVQASPGVPWAGPGASGAGDTEPGPVFAVPLGVNVPHVVDVSEIAAAACSGGGPCILMVRSHDTDGDALQDGQHFWLINATIALSCTAPPVCGNHEVETGEGCDDGNTVSGDGCSAACEVEGGGAAGGSSATSGAGGATSSSSGAGGAAGGAGGATSGSSSGGAGGSDGGCP